MSDPTPPTSGIATGTATGKAPETTTGTALGTATGTAPGAAPGRAPGTPSGATPDTAPETAPGAAPETPATSKSALRESIEERCLGACLISLECHYRSAPPMGPLETEKVTALLNRALELTFTYKHVREDMSRNVGVWLFMTKIFAAAIPTLTARSIAPLAPLDETIEKDMSSQESAALIVKNYATLRWDLFVLNKLMHIARNIIVTASPEVPQDISAAVHFDQMVYQTIILCVNVTSKGCDSGEMKDEATKDKLYEITESYKRLLVTALQQAHNWIANHDRNKMAFWNEVLFEEDPSLADPPGDFEDITFQFPVARSQVHNWLEFNSEMCPEAISLLRDYSTNLAGRVGFPGALSLVRPLAWNWLPEAPPWAPPKGYRSTKIVPLWNPCETDARRQDMAYGRTSRELDSWWIRMRDPNYEEWTTPMPTIDFARMRMEHCITHMSHRYVSSGPVAAEDGSGGGGECPEEDDDGGRQGGGGAAAGGVHSGETVASDYADDGFDDDYGDDDDSYCEGPLTGMLTDIPNILDPRQIETLHMLVKSCISDLAFTGVSNAGENLQRTRCRMFMALDCGRSLFREMLVFIAVWDQDEQSLVFQFMVQIVISIHSSALIPYAWNSLRIPKDIISPAQAVLLRLVSCMYRLHNSSQNQDKTSGGYGQAITGPPAPATPAAPAAPTAPATPATPNRPVIYPDGNPESDAKLLHFLFGFFRTRIVPEVVALMHLQSQFRDVIDYVPDFPVDAWDMERAREGLSQYLEFLTTAGEATELRVRLIEWEIIFDLVAILNALESSVAKRPQISAASRRRVSIGQGQASSAPATSTVDSGPPLPSDEEERLRQETMQQEMQQLQLQDQDQDQQQQQQDQQQQQHDAGLEDTESEQSPPHLFAWAGIKGQIFTIMATLLQPPPGKSSPGNPEVQRQIVRFNGIVPLLNCCAYDDHNTFARERVTICLKWLLDGCESANTFFRELVSMNPRQAVAAHAEVENGEASSSSSPFMGRAETDPTLNHSEGNGH